MPFFALGLKNFPIFAFFFPIIVKKAMNLKFLSPEGKVFAWLKKHRTEILAFIATKFDFQRPYTEKEVNDIILQWITFEDYVLIRRELYDNGYLDRSPDGRMYWRVEKTV